MSTDSASPALTSYDEVPYTSFAYADTHIDRLGCIAKLFGMTPADPAHCRVLEIGCAAGGNLAPMGAVFKDSEFVGIDLSSRQIAQGREMIAEMGIDNVDLRHLDLMDVDESLGTFDYIIAHGVYSWVPPAVRQKLLAICSENLAPQGVAYVSYNTYPGWHMRGMIRDMMLYHTANLTDPEVKTGQARALLEFLAQAAPLSKNAYSIMLQTEVDTLKGLENSYLFHDHLAEHNDPVYFHQFMERAIEADLQYLGESTFTSMLPMHFPQHVQEAFAKVTGDIVKVEQYMDFVRNRTFRQTLMVHSEVELDRTLDWSRMTSFRFRSAAKPQSTALVDVTSDAEVVYEYERYTVTTTVPLLKAAMRILLDVSPASLPFAELRDRARAMVGGEPADDDRVLGGNLLTCYANGIVAVSLVKLPMVREVSERPVAFSVARFLAQKKALRVTNVRHESGDADQILRHALALADGTRTRDDLVDALTEQVLTSGFSVSRRDGGKQLESPEEIREAFDEVIDQALQSAAELSFLVG